MKTEEKLLENFIKEKKLKHSSVRNKILNIFLNIERHLTVEELYTLAKKLYPSIGYATVYRTLKLLCEVGLCRELKFDDGITRYEHLYGHQHHDHIVCTKCGKIVEVASEELEKLQNQIAKKNKFKILDHKLIIYGLCEKCK